jgi:hypothetical protein
MGHVLHPTGEWRGGELGGEVGVGARGDVVQGRGGGGREREKTLSRTVGVKTFNRKGGVVIGAGGLGLGEGDSGGGGDGGGLADNERLAGATHALDLRAWHSKMWRGLGRPHTRGEQAIHFFAKETIGPASTPGSIVYP